MPKTRTRTATKLEASLLENEVLQERLKEARKHLRLLKQAHVQAGELWADVFTLLPKETVGELGQRWKAVDVMVCQVMGIEAEESVNN